MAKRFLVAPLSSGLQTNMRPWLIPDDAYAQLQNMYLYRARLRKRFGSTYTYPETAPTAGTEQLYSRMRINVGTLTSGAKSGTVPAAVGAIGQLFSIGNNIFTVYQSSGNMLKNGTATTYTFDTSNGNFVFDGLADADGTVVYWYPAYPIMGIAQFESSEINFEPTYVFDTKYAYTWNNGWERSELEADSGAATWTGSNSNFFWASSWRGSDAYSDLFFVTNFKFTAGGSTSLADKLRYLSSANEWTFFTPTVNSGGTTLYTCRVVLPFKDRLLALNTVEDISGAGTLQQFANRCRFSQNGNPVDATNAWLEDTGGRGGYLDAPTKEQIISAQFLKDRLIVFFESSTWELVYTGNEILPFRWQKINTELGVESTFSVIPFDEVVLGVGNLGIHACNGASVQRIDQKIPDLAFAIKNESEGVLRVQGVRDYKIEQVYWSYPDTTQTTVYPTQVLVYDYTTGNWAINDDSITAFGYFQNQSSLTWANWKETWAESTWTWGSGTIQSQFPQVLAGNQEGFVFIANPVNSFRNASALQVTQVASNVLTIVDNNLQQDAYIKLDNINGVTFYNSSGVAATIFRITKIDGNEVTIDAFSVSGTYTGGGTVGRISQPMVLTKQYNFFNDIGTNMTVNRLDVLVDRTTDGEITIQSLASSSDQILESLVMETKPYDVTYYPLEQTQTRLWHTVYPNLNGEVAQFKITLSDTQMRDTAIVESDIQLHAFMYHVDQTSSRFE